MAMTDVGILAVLIRQLQQASSSPPPSSAQCIHPDTVSTLLPPSSKHNLNSRGLLGREEATGGPGRAGIWTHFIWTHQRGRRVWRGDSRQAKPGGGRRAKLGCTSRGLSAGEEAAGGPSQQQLSPLRWCCSHQHRSTTSTHMDSRAERRRQADQVGQAFGPTPFGLISKGEGCGKEAVGRPRREGGEEAADKPNWAVLLVDSRAEKTR
jgi:hypothetical protein